MPGHSTTDAIFVIRQIEEKFCAADKTLYMAFVDLEKASIVYPDMLSGGLIANSASTGSSCGSYGACMKMPEVKCVLVIT